MINCIAFMYVEYTIYRVSQQTWKSKSRIWNCLRKWFSLVIHTQKPVIRIIFSNAWVKFICCPVCHPWPYYENITGTTYVLSCPSSLFILRKYYRHNIYADLSVTTDHITKILQAQHICCPVRHHWSYYENTIGTKYAVLSVTTDHITKIQQAQHICFPVRYHWSYYENTIGTTYNFLSFSQNIL